MCALSRVVERFPNSTYIDEYNSPTVNVNDYAETLNTFARHTYAFLLSSFFSFEVRNNYAYSLYTSSVTRECKLPLI